MKQFRTYKISFKDWEEYDELVNTLYENGEEIVETLVQSNFEPMSTSQHVVRLKQIKETI